MNYVFHLLIYFEIYTIVTLSLNREEHTGGLRCRREHSL